MSEPTAAISAAGSVRVSAKRRRCDGCPTTIEQGHSYYAQQDRALELPVRHVAAFLWVYLCRPCAERLGCLGKDMKE